MTKSTRHYIELTKYLTKREIAVRYKQSFLGLFWVILNPFFQMLTMSFVFSYVFKFDFKGVPYPLFIYAGLLPWVLFTGSVTNSMTSLVDGSKLISKIYFPREILVLSSILAKCVDFALSFVIFLCMMVYYQQAITWHVILFVPLFFLQFLFIYGLSLILSVLNLLYRDIQYLVSLLLTLLFYLTPVVYQTEAFPEAYRWIFKVNPLSVFINAYRQVLLAHDTPRWESLGVGVAISLLLFFIGFRFFKKMEGTFADIM